MKGRKWMTYFCSLGLVVLLLAGFGTVLAERGGQDDPLITLSYLNNQMTESILKQVDEKLASKGAELSAQLENQIDSSGTGASGASGGTYQVVSLASGKTLTGRSGTEVLARSGKVLCISSASPGLLDLTSGGTLENGGVLSTNHLYIMTEAGKGVQASGATATLLVRGGYAVS